MRTLGKLFIIMAALLALGAAFVWKHLTASATPEQLTAESASQPFTSATSSAQHSQGLPRLAAPTATLAAERVKAFESLKQRAKAGDAVAQRQLAQAYDACFVVNLDRQRFVTGYEALRMREPEHAAVLDHLAQQRMAQCDAVDGGAIVPMELIRGWYAQAAQNGDLFARAMDNALNLRPYDTARATRLMDDVVASGDPAAVYALGGNMSETMVENMGEPYRALVTGPEASTAWMLAGCRMGYDCGPESTEIVNLCLLSNRCLGETYEEMVFATLKSDAERQALERKIQQVMDAVTP